MASAALTILRDNAGPGLWLSLLGIAVILASAAYWLLQQRSRRPAADPARRTRALVAAVVDLDEDYEKGKIDNEEYFERRALLADVLLARIGNRDSTEEPVPQPLA